MFKWRLVRLLATEYASIDNEEKLPFIRKVTAALLNEN